MPRNISVPVVRRFLLRTYQSSTLCLQHSLLTTPTPYCTSAGRHMQLQQSFNLRNITSRTEKSTAVVEEPVTISRIRGSLRRRGVSQWGFALVRCTYTSQDRWDEYVRRIKHHITADLEATQNLDLLAALDIPILEDVGMLEGASWKQARDKFDEWLVFQMMEHDASIQTREEAIKVFKSTCFGAHAPRYEFCLVADEESVESVLRCNRDDEKRISEPGNYFFTIVANGIDDPRETTELDNRTVWKDREDIIETRRALWQKFKANEFMGLYAACDVKGWQWPEGFSDDGSGVSRLGIGVQ